MLALFRTNQLLASAFFVPYLLLLRGSIFLTESDWTPSAMGIYSKWLYDAIGSKGLAPDILAMSILLLEAIIICLVFLSQRLTNEASLFPGVCLILLSSFFPEFLHLSPILIGNLFFLIAYWELVITYRKSQCADRIFNVGFWLGIASLFYFSFLMLIIWAFVGFTIIRSFRFKERLMYICGIIVPYFLTGVYSFWIDQYEVFLQVQFVNNVGLLDWSAINLTTLLSRIIPFGVLLIWLLITNEQIVFKQKIQVKKMISLWYWSLLFLAFTIFFQAQLTTEHLLVIALPMASLMSISFLSRNSGTIEVIHLLMVAFALFMQFYA